jgi:hypothetical protein
MNALPLKIMKKVQDRTSSDEIAIYNTPLEAFSTGKVFK